MVLSNEIINFSKKEYINPRFVTKMYQFKEYKEVELLQGEEKITANCIKAKITQENKYAIVLTFISNNKYEQIEIIEPMYIAAIIYNNITNTNIKQIINAYGININ